MVLSELGTQQVSIFISHVHPTRVATVFTYYRLAMAATGLNPTALPFETNISANEPNIPDNLKLTIERDLRGMIAGQDQPTKNLADLNSYMFKKLKILEFQIATIYDNQTRTLSRQIQDLELNVQYLTQENRMLTHQLALVEDATKILSLRVEGLPETNEDNLTLYVCTTLSKTGVSCTAADIDTVHRVGKHREGYIRPIIVRFLRLSKRNAILYNRANLSKINPSPLVWVNDDTSDQTRRSRKSVRDVVTLAKTIGIQDTKIHGDGVIIENIKYKHQDLDLLPNHLSLAKAKSRSDDIDLFFQGEHSPLSNFYPARIEDNDHTIFASAEQLFQHKRAIFESYPITAEKIKKNSNPYEIKRLGNLVPLSDQWKNAESDIMSDILLKKFCQNPKLGAFLTNTADLNLHEATNDRKWWRNSRPKP